MNMDDEVDKLVKNEFVLHGFRNESNEVNKIVEIIEKLKET